MAIGSSNALLSVPEAAGFLSIPERTLRENRARWGIPAHRVSRTIRFRMRDLEAWLEKNKI
jgi:excisionase family DNA binding protein